MTATLIVGVIAGVVANSGTVYTWEKTFEVKKQEIKCRIMVGDCRVVGCPVKVWVCLRLGGCCWCEWKDARDDCCKEWKDKWDDDLDGHCGDECDANHVDLCEDGSQVNGTYSVQLYWWNSTAEDWEHVMYLQEETNLTLTCFGHVETYTFVPMWEGEYKVVVTFAVDSEVYNFTSED